MSRPYVFDVEMMSKDVFIYVLIYHFGIIHYLKSCEQSNRGISNRLVLVILNMLMNKPAGPPPEPISPGQGTNSTRSIYYSSYRARIPLGNQFQDINYLLQLGRPMTKITLD